MRSDKTSFHSKAKDLFSRSKLTITMGVSIRTMERNNVLFRYSEIPMEIFEITCSSSSHQTLE